MLVLKVANTHAVKNIKYWVKIWVIELNEKFHEFMESEFFLPKNSELDNQFWVK
jgi:hypothetical protein